MRWKQNWQQLKNFGLKPHYTNLNLILSYMETQTAIAGIRNIKVHEYKIELSVNARSQPVARLSKFLSSGKNKGTYKHIEGFYFRDEERRTNWIKDKIASINTAHKLVQNRKQIKADARNNFVNPFKVGELFYDSWGYEQTNIDFYMIVDVKAKSVVLQKIGQDIVRSAGDMCEYVKPDIKDKIGKPVLKPVQVRVYSDKVSYHINGYRGSISPYDAGERGLYQSHYA